MRLQWAIAGVLATGSVLSAQEWPGWRGPSRGRIYGMSARRKGQLVILDAATGSVKSATEGRDGSHASILVTPEHVMFLTDGGALIVAPRGSDKLVAERRYEIAASSTWTLPVLLPDGMLVREATGLAMLKWH